MGPVGVSLIYEALCLLSLLPPRPFATLDSSAHSPLAPADSLQSLPLKPQQPQPSSPQPEATGIIHVP